MGLLSTQCRAVALENCPSNQLNLCLSNTNTLPKISNHTQFAALSAAAPDIMHKNKINSRCHLKEIQIEMHCEIESACSRQKHRCYFVSSWPVQTICYNQKYVALHPVGAHSLQSSPFALSVDIPSISSSPCSSALCRKQKHQQNGHLIPTDIPSIFH